MAVVTMKNLLESGVHFGHQTKRWDPRMKKYIFAERNGIHIIDLQKTIVSIREAFEAVRKSVLEGKSVLFVGTKKQAQQAVEREAQRCGMFYVNSRWLGGMLTNFSTIKRSLLRLKKIEKMEVDGTFEKLTKKEISRLMKERTRLERSLGGIKEMKELPGVVFVIDTRKEAIAVAEAKRLKLPIIAIVDTNCNPEGIDYPIPGNDDAIRAINLFAQIIANAVIEAENEVGLEIIETLQDDTTNEDFTSYVDKDEISEDEKYNDGEEEKENTETVAVGAAVAGATEEKEEQDKAGFTDKDYSEYNPEEEEAKKDTEKKVPAQQVDLADEHNVDEDKLYDE